MYMYYGQIKSFLILILILILILVCGLIVGSSCQPLQQVLRRVCGQISDLAAPSALCVARGLLDGLLESLDATLEKWQSLEDQQGRGDQQLQEKMEIRSSGHTSRILTLLSYVMAQPPIKAAFINLTKTGSVYYALCILQ